MNGTQWEKASFSSTWDHEAHHNVDGRFATFLCNKHVNKNKNNEKTTKKIEILDAKIYSTCFWLHVFLN